MRFFFGALVASVTFISQVVAGPTSSISPAASQATCVLHCGGPYGLSCPQGYRCCGPIVEGVGGTCFPGAVGICPL